MRCQWLRLNAAFLVAMAMPGARAADDFPSRPVTIIVSAPAGGTTDVLARLVAGPLGRALGQSVVVENVGGAGGRIGTTKAVRAKPDGYTLNLGNSGFLAASVALYPKLGWDSRKDFAPIGLVATFPMLLAVHPSTPYRKLDDLRNAMAAKPGLVTIATPGPGSASDLATAIFLSRAGLQASMINYRGGGPSLNAVMAGEVEVFFDQPSTLAPLHKGGRVRLLAVSAPLRLEKLPEVPTFAESGLPGFDVQIWNGLVAPVATPQSTLQKLARALSTALEDPEVKAALEKYAGHIPTAAERGPQHLRKVLVEDVDRFMKLVRETGMKAE